MLFPIPRGGVMTNRVMIIMISLCLSVPVMADWTFTTVNPAGSSGDIIQNQGIAWRPQGDYALIAGMDGLYRYDYTSENLAWQSHGSPMYRIAWAKDGSYAVITGSTHIYRYDHAETGFGVTTEIPAGEIQGSGSYDITFFAIAFDPSDDLAPPYIATNREDGSGNNQIVIYRYDPGVSESVYWDYSGGTTYVSSQNYQPRAMSFRTTGDYFVLTNYWGDQIQGFFTYDPDGSTFPSSGGAMQFKNVSMGNATAIALKPGPGDGLLIVKGTGQPHCFIETGLPASWVEHDTGASWHTALTTGGEASWSYDGSRCIVSERQEWTPYHHVMLFDGNGDSITSALAITSAGFANETQRIYAVAWHPRQPAGLMAGGERWIFKFETTDVPTPQPTLGPTMTPSPTPAPPSMAFV